MTLKATLLALTALAASPLFAKPLSAATVVQTNLVSDGAVAAAAVTDPNLKNPWGISYSPTGAFWVSDNATGLSTLYNSSGAIVPLVVTIPPAPGGTVGNPTGQVFYPGTGFVVSKGGKSGAPPFIFDSEDGTISGWSPSVDGTNAIIAVDRSAMGAVYKSLALYTDSTGKSFLLAADFHNNEIDVFDSTYTLKASFSDKANLPKGYAPYNVANLGGQLFVTYAKQDAAKHDSVSGPGLGAVERIDITGKVMKRFVGGKLNAPWGLAIAPASFGHLKGDIMVGNFGDGRITAFSPHLKQGKQLQTTGGKTLSIDGLWALIPGNGGSGGSASDLYFTAGPNGEADGLLGSLAPAG